MSVFWDLMNEEFSSGWVMTDEQGMIQTTMDNLEKLYNFIAKWNDKKNLIG